MDPVGFDFDRNPIPPTVLAQMPASVAYENGVIPVAVERSQIVVASSDLDDTQTVKKLRFLLGREVALTYATRAAITAALQKYYPGADRGVVVETARCRHEIVDGGND